MNAQWVIIIVAAVAGYFTKPTDEQFAKFVHQRAKFDIVNTQPKDKNDILSNLVRVGCSMDLDSCANMIMNDLTASYSDYVVLRTVALTRKDGEKIATCLGGFKVWWCRGWGVSD